MASSCSRACCVQGGALRQSASKSYAELQQCGSEGGRESQCGGSKHVCASSSGCPCRVVTYGVVSLLCIAGLAGEGLLVRRGRERTCHLSGFVCSVRVVWQSWSRRSLAVCRFKGMRFPVYPPESPAYVQACVCIAACTGIVIVRFWLCSLLTLHCSILFRTYELLCGVCVLRGKALWGIVAAVRMYQARPARGPPRP